MVEFIHTSTICKQSLIFVKKKALLMYLSMPLLTAVIATPKVALLL